MTTVALVQRLEAAGCSLALEGGAVKLRGPREALTAELIAEARRHKAELLEYLRRSLPTVGSEPRPPAPLTRRDFARLAGDAAAAIHQHCEGCRTCPEAPAFGSIIAPLGCCAEGRRVWTAYRRAMADFNAAVEVN